MIAHPTFNHLDEKCWANVRIIGQMIGYTKEQQIRTYSRNDLHKAMQLANLGSIHLEQPPNGFMTLGEMLIADLDYRADVLNRYVEPRLMTSVQATELLKDVRSKLPSTLKIPMNKQSGVKCTEAYFTALINLLVGHHLQGMPFNHDPRQLTSFTLNNEPVRTFSRRVDGCFPQVVNPVALWEIKEYYHTTTLGSRVADGIYETQLDGMEIREMREKENIVVLHYLMIDAYLTWWTMGKSYLCRIVDMLHMGYIDEVLFGREVIERLPDIVQGWVSIYKARTG